MKIFLIIGILLFPLLVVGSIDSCSIIIEASVSPTTYDQIGQIITYTYNVTCKEGHTYGPILLKDNINNPEPITFSGPLKKGKIVEGTATYTITQADIDRGFVTNLANATGKSTKKGFYNVISNNATATVKASKKPALSLEKSADPIVYSAAGQKITYAYRVTNSGNVVISGPIKVTDDKLGTVSISSSELLPGQSVTGTATYTISQHDLNTGYVTNIAYVTGTHCGKEVRSGTDTETITSIKAPPTAQVPEFPSIALPVASILGLLFISQYRRKVR